MLVERLEGLLHEPAVCQVVDGTFEVAPHIDAYEWQDGVAGIVYHVIAAVGIKVDGGIVVYLGGL